MVRLPCSRKMSGGTTSAASTATSRPAIQVVWRADDARDAGSAEEVIENLLPSRQVALDRLGREEAHAEVAVLRLERRVERRHRRIGGGGVGLALNLLAFPREGETHPPP